MLRLQECFSNPQPGSLHISWEFIRNEVSQASFPLNQKLG